MAVQQSNIPGGHHPPLRSLPSAAPSPAPLTSSSPPPPPPPTFRHRLSCSLPLQPAAGHPRALLHDPSRCRYHVALFASP